MMRSLRRLWRNTDGAVAALYALSLPALIAVAGVGFDYSRLVGMDSELQNAADQAALAGVTQLDGMDGACARAAAAASSLVSNKTLLSNDGKGLAISVPAESGCDASGIVRFWSTVNSDGVGVTEATSDADANYVEIVLDDRAAKYAFTPIAGLLMGQLRASATAGLHSAICNADILYMCNVDSDTFDITKYAGVGVNVTKDGSKGNWGFIGPDNSNPTLRRTLGLDAPRDACDPVSGTVNVSPGRDANKQVVDAFNTRFDLGNGCPGPGTCSASANVTKDLVEKGTATCPSWQESGSPYAPKDLTPLDGTATRPYPDAMGYPRDICHAVSATGAGCVGPSTTNKDIIGDGKWDVGAYFYVNYGINNWATDPNLADLPRNPKTGLPLRYDVYQWELKHAGDIVNGHKVLANRTVSGTGGNALYARGAPQCLGSITPSVSNIDRRLISVAVVSKSECAKIHGNSYNPQVQQWVDAFLIEPMADRKNTYKTGGGTGSKEIYVEIVRATPPGGQALNPARRDVPYLLR